MLIDSFVQDYDKLFRARINEASAGCNLYLLIDGAFICNIHKSILADKKRLLFERLPSCNDETKSVSPFLIIFDQDDRRQWDLLSRCNGWPMVNVIETPESLDELYNRLATWCVVEANTSYFNFRFADTRRLPAIFRVLTSEQKAHFLGCTRRWSYIGRDGGWSELDLRSPCLAVNFDDSFSPSLTTSQFAALVDDSHADELAAIMSYRGETTGLSFFQLWNSISIALKVATVAALNDSVTDVWAMWFAKSKYKDDEEIAMEVLNKWLEVASAEHELAGGA